MPSPITAAVTYYNKSDYTRAIADFDQILKLNPALEAACRNRAKAQAALACRKPAKA
jgi:tetratricopeptide (TPR) repeat protein